MPTITIRLPAELIAGLDKLATGRGSNRSDALREIVESALHETRPPKHNARMAPLKSEPPGMERDSRGNAIPLKQRTRDDQEKVKLGKIVKATKKKTQP
jgi:hypothetical protein